MEHINTIANCLNSPMLVEGRRWRFTQDAQEWQKRAFLTLGPSEVALLLRGIARVMANYDRCVGQAGRKLRVHMLPTADHDSIQRFMPSCSHT